MSADEFGGVVGRTWRDSRPWWPPEPSAPPGAPNIVMVVLDDVGFAQLGCYGSDIDTPSLDALAAQGVRFSGFHTTSLCSPTRACLLSGRNHHSNGMGRISELSIGFPGYWGRIPRSNGLLPEMLGHFGYVPVAVGKWHLTPDRETHQAAPRDTWPCARGFQRWYGFHGGETHQFVPSLFQDNHAADPPASPSAGYHLTEDLADRAIRYLGEIRSAAPDTPFFLYFATGACHSPHQAPRPWIDRYSGAFDAGWDDWRDRTFSRQIELGLFEPGTRISDRPPWVPAWDSLSPGDRPVAARFMECFAGFLSHADSQIGRVLQFVRGLGEWDNTVVIVVSDNGASAEGGQLGSINDVRTWNAAPAGPEELRARIDELGGPTAHNNYPWGWTMAGNTPFRRWKREVHQGGIADPCIFSWPAGIPSDASVRRQFAHAIDIVPTVLDMVGVEAPSRIGGTAQTPIEGVSLRPVLQDPAIADVHPTQYFEMLGSRGIYHRGWKAVTFHPFVDLYGEGRDPDAPFDDDQWELYDVRADPAETRDLASAEPRRLAEMIDLWWSEAERYQVLPLDNRLLDALVDPRHQPPDRREQVVWPDGAIVPELQVVNMRNRPHTVSVRVTVPSGGAEGVLLAMGTALGGWSFQVAANRLRYVNNFLGAERHVIEAEMELTVGSQLLSFEFEPVESTSFHKAGRARLFVDRTQVAEGLIERTAFSRYSITGGGLTCGWEQGPAVGEDYEAPFRFTGELRYAVITVDGDPHRDPLAEFESIMSEQ